MSKMTPFEEKTITLNNNEEIFYRKKKGGSNDLVLLHGNMSASENWDIFMNALSTDFTVYAFDLRGFGESSYKTPIESIKDLSDDVDAVTEKLKLTQFDLVGWSLGGNVAMQFALDYPKKVDKLGLLSSGPLAGFPVKKRYFLNLIKGKTYLSTKEEIKKSVKFVETLREKKRRKMIRGLLNKTLYTHAKPNVARLVKYENAFMNQRNLADVNYALTYFNISHHHNGVIEGNNKIDHIQHKTLILHGENDKIVPPKHAYDIKEALGERAELITYSNAGHALMVDRTSKLSSKFHEFFIGT